MHNIFDYLTWRGDLSFDRDEFNEVDSLIFSVLAYIKFEKIFPGETNGKPRPLNQAAQWFKETMTESSPRERRPFFKYIQQLLYKAAHSQRFRTVQLSNYVNQVDYEKSEQFSAVVFSINDRQHCIAFRGTDNTLAGWKEDFYMSFLDEVPAQKQAVIYMNQVMSRLAGKFYLGGHSKGGNLAVYAAAHATHAERERILAIYNNDGPGFQTRVTQSQGYQSILGKTSTLIPKSSVVGMLLEHWEEYKVVGSSATGLMQHDAFSWQVAGKSFVSEQGLSHSSLAFNKALRAWLEQIPMQQRAEFVDAMFEIIQASGAMTLSDLTKEKWAAADAMIKTYKNMDSATQMNLKKTIELFFAESQRTLRNSISAGFDSFISKKFPKRKGSSPHTGQA